MRRRQKKRDILFKEFETLGKWQKRNKHETNRFLRKKKRK